MMIEAVPFFHILVTIIQNEVGDDVSLPSFFDDIASKRRSANKLAEKRSDRDDNGSLCIQFATHRSGVLPTRCIPTGYACGVFPAAHSCWVRQSVADI